MCENCKSHKKRIYVPGSEPKNFKIIEEKLMFFSKLLECPVCHSKWIKIYHEPYSSFDFSVLWNNDVDLLKEIIKDNDNLIYKWHTSFISTHWESLEEEDKLFIQSYMKRCYGTFPWKTEILYDIEKEIDEYRINQK